MGHVAETLYYSIDLYFLLPSFGFNLTLMNYSLTLIRSPYVFCVFFFRYLEACWFTLSEWNRVAETIRPLDKMRKYVYLTLST